MLSWAYLRTSHGHLSCLCRSAHWAQERARDTSERGYRRGLSQGYPVHKVQSNWLFTIVGSNLTGELLFSLSFVVRYSPFHDSIPR